MTYNEILNELQEVNLKDKFVSEYENFESPTLLIMLKETDKISSTANLIRSLMKKWEIETENWIYWQKVMFYFMTPVFARKENQLPK